MAAKDVSIQKRFFYVSCCSNAARMNQLTKKRPGNPGAFVNGNYNHALGAIKTETQVILVATIQVNSQGSICWCC